MGWFFISENNSAFVFQGKRGVAGSVGKPGSIVSQHGHCFSVADLLLVSTTQLELSRQGGFKLKE